MDMKSKIKSNGTLRWIGRKAFLVGAFLAYLLTVTVGLSIFQFALVGDETNRPILGHITLLVWSVCAAMFVGVRSYWKRRHFRCSFIDGVVAGVIMYAGIALLSEVLKDMAREVEMIMTSVFWQLAMICEISLVFAGTWILITRETSGDRCKTCRERNRQQLELRDCAETSPRA